MWRKHCQTHVWHRFSKCQNTYVLKEQKVTKSISGGCWEMQSPQKSGCMKGRMASRSSTCKVNVPCCMSVHSPVSGFELAGELGPLLFVFPLQVADGEWDALLTVCSQAAAVRGGCGAGRWRQRAAGRWHSKVNNTVQTCGKVVTLHGF